MKHIVILISGGGSNMAAIVRAAEREDWARRLGARVAAVVSNRADAGGLVLAREKGIATEVLDHKTFASREAFDAALAERIDRHAPALVVWHGMAPAKSLFFSAVASWRNLGAMAVFSLIWTTLSVTVFMVAAMIGGALGGASGVMGLLYPLGIVLAAMFFASIYFTFADSFEPD